MANNTVNGAAKLMYGARRKSRRSAPAGMMSSLQSSFNPSAGDCSQPKRPPTRVGPSRSWIRPATFRSIQMNTATETMHNRQHAATTCTSAAAV